MREDAYFVWAFMDLLCIIGAVCAIVVKGGAL